MRLSRIAIPATLALLASCSSDKTTAPVTQQPVSLNQAFSEISMPALSNAAALGGTGVQAFGAPASSGCAYAAASQLFVCPTVTASGLTITQSYSLLDAAGKPQSQFDAGTTAAVRVVSSINGTIAASGTSLTIAEHQDVTLSGLQTGTHVLNGSMTMNANGSVVTGGTSTPIATSMTTTMTNIVLPQAGSSSTWPVSGTITDDATTSVANSPTVTTHLVITFNGTNKASVTITIAGISQHCTIDLSAAAPTCS